MMNIAKRLDFDPTGSLNIAEEAGHAIEELQKAVKDLSAITSQKHGQILALAKQSAEQGIGDNDLKRLKRQFDSNKATFVNIDQKQRFMRGLLDLDLDLEKFTSVKDQLEQQQEKEAETLRALKAQNEKARADLTSTSASIHQLYTMVEQATAATKAQLAATTTLLQQHASSRTPVDDTPVEPGPGQVEAQVLVEEETAEAKGLERSIAAAEAELSEVESKAAAGRQELTALRAEITRLEVLASDVARAADADCHVKDAAQWCTDLLSLMSQLGGLSVISADAEQLVLGIHFKLPTSRQPGSHGMREIHHELTLQLLSQADSATSGTVLSAARLVPEVPHIKAFLEATIDGTDVSPACIVSELRHRLLSYWQRQVLVEAAAEVYPPASSSRGPPHVKATLHHQIEVEVLVPWSWPSGPAPLQVAQLHCPQLKSEAAEEVMISINRNGHMLQHCDLLQLLQNVESVIQEQLVDALAA